MNTLIIKEHHRNGNFEIYQGKQGNVEIITTKLPVIGMIASKDPTDFNFDLACYRDEKPIGHCQFNWSMMEGKTLAMIKCPIEGSDDNSYIIFKVCLIKPYKNNLNDTIFIKYPKLFSIGHRGSGENAVSKEYFENSLISFEAAENIGADFVEFDIQMTKDGIPVIYHDFHMISEEKIQNFPEPICKVGNGKYAYAIRQLTIDQFKKYGLTTNYHTENAILEELLTKIPKRIGFDAEVKYPCYKKYNNTIPYCEINQFVDSILEVMEKNAGDRKIFFSSFDPLTVIALKLKQNKWPVFQLEKTKKETIEDMVKKIRSFIEFHKRINVTGFVGDSDHVSQAPFLVKEINDNDFIFCTYGNQNDNQEGIKKQIQLGVKGICTNKLRIAHSVINENQI